jgi:formate dehydrogenase major subunit
VEIEGRRGYPASCTTPAEAGMQVRTQSDRLAEIRRGVMELSISDHPLDCLTCAANGNRELQDMAGVVGLREVRYGMAGEIPVANHFDAQSARPKDESNPYFTFDPAKCIACSRCVRACAEAQGTFALAISGRGFDSRVSAGQDQPFMESECVSCGACVQACPTATPMEKTFYPAGPGGAVGRDHLRLLRGGLRLQGGGQREPGGAHGPLEGRSGQPRALLRQGPLRLGLRDPPGPDQDAPDPHVHP